MLSRRELVAFCVAPAAAPAAGALFFDDRSQVLIIAVVSYLAAFILGLPLFTRLRVSRSLASSSVIAAVASGALVGGLVVALALVLSSVARFTANPGASASLIGIGAFWGAGLGFGAGLALFVLLRLAAVPERRG
jgi:hypothetical protein